MDPELRDALKKIDEGMRELRDYAKEEITSDEREKIKDKIEEFKAKAEMLRSKAYKTKGKVESFAKEHPWEVIGISMAAGALIVGLMSAIRKKHDR